MSNIFLQFSKSPDSLQLQFSIPAYRQAGIEKFLQYAKSPNSLHRVVEKARPTEPRIVRQNPASPEGRD